ncbi:MAG TPA: hypothetical protein VL501_01750, partial [Pyrinomonadaceae bacterium]|nr:hypothetical protein [Pyrinomonadaceae bacterium]
MIRIVLFVLALALLAGSSFAQELPSKIRGYKVHNVKVHVTTTADDGPDDSEASIVLGEPKIVETTLTGVVFEATAEVRGATQSGDIDFLVFKDIVVNGIAVDADEYVHAFKLKKGETVKLP